MLGCRQHVFGITATVSPKFCLHSLNSEFAGVIIWKAQSLAKQRNWREDRYVPQILCAISDSVNGRYLFNYLA